jgi:hypothetical protein
MEEEMNMNNISSVGEENKAKMKSDDFFNHVDSLMYNNKVYKRQ